MMPMQCSSFLSPCARL